MILFVQGMLFSCQHKAVAIFRAKGHILAALRAQLRNTEPVHLQITHMHRAKGQRPKRRAVPVHSQHCNFSQAWGEWVLLLLLLDFTPSLPLPTSPGCNEVSKDLYTSPKSHIFCNFYVILPVNKCLTLKSLLYPAPESMCSNTHRHSLVIIRDHLEFGNRFARHRRLFNIHFSEETERSSRSRYTAFQAENHEI